MNIGCGGPWLAAACLALSSAAHAASTNVCDEEVVHLRLPGQWKKVERDGIVSYRSANSTEAVTTTVYELTQPVDEAARTQIMLRSAALSREGERTLSGGRVALSNLSQRRFGVTQQLCYAGEEKPTDRRFVSITLSSARLLQHIYYEAVGLSAPQFEGRAQTILGRGDAPAAMALRLGHPSALEALRSANPINLPLPQLLTPR